MKELLPLNGESLSGSAQKLSDLSATPLIKYSALP